jgi:hypothetical protein
MKHRGILHSTGKTTTGFKIPAEMVEQLGGGKRPPVKVVIGSHTWRTTIAPMGGEFWLGVSAENRAGAGIAAGDEVELEFVLDTEPRELEVPADFAAALDAVPEARTFFDGISYSNRRWHVMNIEAAKTEETRQKRIAKSVEMLREGRAR